MLNLFQSLKGQAHRLTPTFIIEPLLLRYGQDLKVGEIAEILGLSRFQVMYRVRGALRQLKKLLKEDSP